MLRLIPSTITQLAEEVQVPLLSFILPLINTVRIRHISCHVVLSPLARQRLTTDPPEAPCLALTRFFSYVARSHPKIFFKPLFVCAAANKDLTVVNQLCTLTALAKFLPDLWLWDAEMMSVALLSDAGGNTTGSDTTQQGPQWSKPRLGQCALLVELLDRLKSVTESRDLAIVRSLAILRSCGSTDVTYRFRLLRDSLWLSRRGWAW